MFAFECSPFAFGTAFHQCVVWVTVCRALDFLLGVRRNCTNPTIQNNCKNASSSQSVLPMPVAVTRTRGQSRSYSFSVRLLSPCCLQHQVFGPSRKRAKEATRPQSKQQTPSSRSLITHMAPRSPPISANLFRSWCHQKAQTISVLHSVLPTTDNTQTETGPTHVTYLDCLFAARPDLGMNWRRLHRMAILCERARVGKRSEMRAQSQHMCIGVQ